MNAADIPFPKTPLPHRPPRPFDFPGLLRCAFEPPATLSQWLIGAMMVLLIPLFGLGWIALAGFVVQTARRTLEERTFRLAEWDGFGGILLDGLRAFVVMLVFSVAAGLGWALLALVIDAAARGIGIGAAEAMAGFSLAVGGLLTGVLGLALVPTALLALAATGRLRDAFTIAGKLDLVRSNPGVYLRLLLALLLIEVLTTATFALCGIGIVPGMFWGAAMTGAAIGHAGLRMGVRSALI